MTDTDLAAWAQGLLDIPYSDTFEQAQTKIAKLRDMAPDLARALIASAAARKLAEERLEKAVDALKRIAGASDMYEPAAWAIYSARDALKEITNGTE